MMGVKKRGVEILLKKGNNRGQVEGVIFSAGRGQASLVIGIWHRCDGHALVYGLTLQTLFPDTGYLVYF